jgi:hypothetical protein
MAHDHRGNRSSTPNQGRLDITTALSISLIQPGKCLNDTTISAVGLTDPKLDAERSSRLSNRQAPSTMPPHPPETTPTRILPYAKAEASTRPKSGEDGCPPAGDDQATAASQDLQDPREADTMMA